MSGFRSKPEEHELSIQKEKRNTALKNTRCRSPEAREPEREAAKQPREAHRHPDN